VWPTSARFQADLGKSQQVISRVDAYRGGVLLGTVSTSEGTINVTARNRVRRTADLTVPASLYPTDPVASLLSPYGTYLQMFRGINFGDTRELIPVFYGRVDSVEDSDQFDAKCEVHCTDRMADVNDARFESPRAAPTGNTIITAIRDLLKEACPDAAVDVARGVDVDSQVPSGLMWDTDRGKAVDDLAQSIGAEVYAKPDGRFQIRNVPTLNDPVSWTVNEGLHGTLVTAGRKVSREGIYNVVVTIVERANGDEPIRYTAEDLNVASPTYVGGVFGRVPRFLRNALITTPTQAELAGTALLARSIGATRTRNITCVPNPAAEAGDVITALVAGVTETHIADAFTLPLHAGGGAMTVGTRSTKPDAGDL
jgi:hypothetical protein